MEIFEIGASKTLRSRFDRKRLSAVLMRRTTLVGWETLLARQVLVLKPFMLQGSPIACWLRYRCSETSPVFRLTTMAEAARRGRCEQPGYFVCSTEFLPG